MELTVGADVIFSAFVLLVGMHVRCSALYQMFCEKFFFEAWLWSIVYKKRNLMY